MAARLTAAFLALLIAVFPAAARAAMWHTEGTRLVDGAGSQVRIRGVNVGNWLLWEGWMFGGGFLGGETTMLGRIADVSGEAQARSVLARYQDAYIKESDIAAMERAGFNTIRVPVNWRAFVTDQGCIACDGRGFAHIDRLAGWARRHGLHLILDMHAVPGAQAGIMTADTTLGKADFWKSRGDQARLAELWTTVARRYAGNETIAGYDLINEPSAPSGPTLIAVYRDLIAAIRRVDRAHLIWVEGNKLGSDLSVFTQPLGDNIGYSAHMYTFPTDKRRSRIAESTAASTRLNAPVWIGEMGQSSYVVTAESVGLMADAPGVAGWSYWTWKRAAGSQPAPCALRFPAAWNAVSGFVTGRVLARRPSNEAMQRGTEALVGFVERERCFPDPRMMAALGGR